MLDVPLLTEQTPDGPRYVIDFDGLEAAAPRVSVMLICSPHNPAGRVWTREELRRVGEICLRHGVVPVVDEIHCEFVMPGVDFVPFAAVCPEFEDKCVTLYAASKAFNIAGLQMANFIVKDPAMRARVDKAVNVNEICDVGPFGVVASQAAWTDEGWQWLQGLNAHLWENYLQLRSAMSEFPSLHLYVLEGTYLAWLDVRAVGMSSEDIEKSLTEVEKVRLNAGEMYGAPGFLRINMACPARMFADGLGRIVAGLRRLLAR